MELIKISNTRLKIMLTASDMTHFALDTESFGTESQSTHKAVRLLLDKFRDQIGFQGDNSQLSVQFFPSREGGCEMFISNLQNQDAKKDSEGNIMRSSPQSTTSIGLQKKQNDCFLREFAYRFDSLKKLLSVCQRLLSIGYICESSAFRDQSSNYYLFLSTLSSSPFSIPDEIGFIVEYGSIECPTSVKLYLREYGIPICQTEAILSLGRLL